jgi:protein-tyrosine phosphatase
MTSTPTLRHGPQPERLIALDNVHNFRDLGGYRTADGGSVRWRTLFRSDGLAAASAADLDRLRTFGLRTVVDLRTARELDDHGTFPVDVHPVDLQHLPIMDATWPADEAAHAHLDDALFLVEAYREMLDVGAPRFVAAFELLARPATLPAVFHCAAGKDRTGLLAALLLGALGVADDDIADDYALTAAAIERMRAWTARHRPEAFARMSSLPRAFLGAHREAMAVTLGELRATHGSIGAAVVAMGLDEGTLATLADLLVEH